jgi:hypothetical protein
MQIGNVLRIGRRIFGRRPSLVGLKYWFTELSTNGFYANDKSGLNNHALITDSNCLYYNGTNAKSEVIFTNDVLLVFDELKLSITYSLNGTTWLTWNTGDTLVTGLMSYNSTTRVLTLGYNGTAYFTGWIASVKFSYPKNSTWVDFLHFQNSSGYTVKEYNVLTQEQEDIMLLAQFPAGIINEDIEITEDLIIYDYE